ncbi:putative glycosyltransferase domain protein, partial [Bacteroides fragilis str. 3986 N(B)19]
TLHDCWSFTGHCVHFQNIGCEKWKTGCFVCPNIRDYPKALGCDNSRMNYIEKKRLFTSVERMMIVSVCNWLSDMLSKSYLSQIKRQTIVNGIDLDVFKPSTVISETVKQYALQSKFIVLAVASNWNSTKGESDIYYFSKQMPEDLFIMIGLSKKQIGKLPPNIIGFE